MPRKAKNIWVGLQGEWDWWEPIAAFDTEEAAEKWQGGDRKHRQYFEIPYFKKGRRPAE